MSIEAEIIKFLQANASTGWITFFQIVTTLGSYLGFVISFIIIFIKNKRLGIVFALTFAFASVVNFGLKHIIRRARPFDKYSYIENYGAEDGYSMPSGHSMCGGLFASFLIYHLFCIKKDVATRVLGTIAIGLFPVLIALSRMVLGVHYISDTIVGIIVGILFAILGIWLYNVLEKEVKKKRENK